MEPSVPRDKFRGVWWVFFILGLGTLLPWNFFMTATVYFTGRLKESSNGTAMGAEPERSILESKFNNVITLCAMLPLLLFTCLNSFLHSRVPEHVRVAGSLAFILAVFLLTAVLVKVPLDPAPFFGVTAVSVVVINSFGAVLQGSLFGMAGAFPAAYTAPIMSGQGLAGTFAAGAMICALASGSDVEDSSFGYFISACIVILGSLASYALLPKLEFFQFYHEKKDGGGGGGGQDDGATARLTHPGKHRFPVSSLRPLPSGQTLLLVAGSVEKEKENEENRSSGEPHGISVMAVFKKIWLLAACVCATFTVTIGVFPAVAADTKTTRSPGGAWDVYFAPVACFLLFNLSDWGGRSLSAFCTWPGPDGRLLPTLVCSRVVLVPALMLCNVQPRLRLPVLLEYDGAFAVLLLLLAFSNGYLASLAMCFAPKKVLPEEAETAGSVMAFFLSLGLALGAALSFVFRALV
ncbi:equilibrative nucleoside transporter 1-like [Stigmatopora argus]